MIDAGVVVITVGGGGIPVVADESGHLRGVAAVIDKDYASSLLATSIKADLFLISTAVEKVALNFGTPEQRWIDHMTLSEARQYLAEGKHFKKGSMAPKIQAIIWFLEQGGERAHHHQPGEHRTCDERRNRHAHHAGLNQRVHSPRVQRRHMAKYLVYIETIGDPITVKGPVAHVPALPGASARGETVEEAKHNVRAAIEEYLSLLRDIGEPVPKAGEPIQLEFEETDSTTFVTDYDALRPNEMETLFRWLAVSRQELVDLLRCMPQEMMDWEPGEELLPVAEIICHMAESDLWYTDRLKQWPEAPLYRLAATRGIALERLRAVPETERGRVTHNQSEDWTPRKVMRRMLEHEREHIAQLRRMIEQFQQSHS